MILHTHRVGAARIVVARPDDGLAPVAQEAVGAMTNISHVQVLAGATKVTGVTETLIDVLLTQEAKVT